MKFQIYSLICVCLFLSLSLTGCKNEGQVSVVCTDVDQFETDLGIINIGEKTLGEVLLVDTNIKRIYSLGKLNILPSHIQSSSRRDSMVMLSATKFKFQLSGDVAKADVQVKAALGSQIDNQTTFFLSNSIRKNVEGEIEYLNAANKANPEKYSQPLLDNKNTVIAVVTSMTYADKFEFRLKKNSEANAQVNTLTVGNYDLKVNYSCQNSLDIDAKQDGIFYKVTYFKFDSDKFRLTVLDLDIKDYKMAENSLE